MEGVREVAGMKKEKKIDVSAVEKRLEFIMPKYIESLANSNNDDYQGSFHIFENDEQLLKALFRTKYSADHLDFEFFMGLIHSIVVDDEVFNPKGIANSINDYVENSNVNLNWVAVYPFVFNLQLMFPFKNKEICHYSYGKFKIVTEALKFEEFNKVLQDDFGVKELSRSDYQHQSTQGSKSIKKCPLIMLDVHGSEDSAFNFSKYKINYLINLLEVYAVLSDSHGHSWPINEIGTNHAFFVNKSTGRIIRFPVRKPTRINICPSDNFYSLLNEEFVYFSNMVFNHNDKLFTRLKSALNFFSRGLNGTDKVLCFISYVIAIEAIFSRDKHTPIRITLAEYIALLCYPAEERVEIYKTVKTIYDTRSALVHAGKIDIDTGLFEEAEKIAAKTILGAFRLYFELNESGDIEEKFFNHLRDLRLGISKNQ